MTILSVRDELFHAYRHTEEDTDVTKVIAALGNFADAAKYLTHSIHTLQRKPCVNYKDQLTKTK
jgi:hypothetical protein